MNISGMEEDYISSHQDARNSVNIALPIIQNFSNEDTIAGNFKAGQSINGSVFHSRSFDIRSIIAATYLVAFVLGVAGNGLVIFIIGYYRQVRQKSVANYYIWNLSLADLCYVLTLPLFCFATLARDWPFGVFTCKLAFAIRETNKFCSVFTLMALSADRYMASFSTLGHVRTINIGKIVLLTIWVLCALLSVPYWKYATSVPQRFSSSRYSCRFLWPEEGRMDHERNWIVVQLCFGLIIPVIIIIACYTGLALRLKKLLSVSASSRRRQRPSRRMSKTVLVVVITFIVCQLPYYVMEFIKLDESKRIVSSLTKGDRYMPSVDKYRLHVILTAFSQALVFLSSCCNPFIYGLFNENYRQLYTAAMCRLCCKSTSNQRSRDMPSTSLPLITYGLRFYRKRKCTERTASGSQNEVRQVSVSTQIPAPIDEEEEEDNDK